MYWIIFVTLSISHCICVKSLPVTTRDPGYVDELLQKINFLIESKITCEPQTQFYTNSSNGSVTQSLDCVRRELYTVKAECLNSTSFLESKTIDEQEKIGDNLLLTINLMNRMYPTTEEPDCDEGGLKPLQDFLEKLKLLVKQDFSG